MDELEQSAELPNSDAAHDAAAEEHDQAAEQHDDQDDSASQEQAEEDEEIEIDGKKFALPKSAAAKLQSERLMQQDYTRKTQEVAASRQAIEAEREQVRQHAQQQQQYLDDVADVRAIDKTLKQYAELNWAQLIEENPVQAMQLQQQRALEAERSTKMQGITQKQNEQALSEQQATAKQVQDAEAYVQREIPGWNDQRAAKVVNEYAQAQGLKLDQATARLLAQHPVFFKFMDKAEKFDQLVAKQSAKPQTPAAPPAPVTRVSAARASAKPDPSKMSDSDWYAARKEQQRKR